MINLNASMLAAMAEQEGVADNKEVKAALERITRQEAQDDFSKACEYGFMDVVEQSCQNHRLYLDMNHGLYAACHYGQKEIVQALVERLNESKFPEESIVTGFKHACQANQWAVVSYFINQYKIEQTPALEKILNELQNEEVNHLFELRKLHEHLNDDLTENLSGTKKAKI